MNDRVTYRTILYLVNFSLSLMTALAFLLTENVLALTMPDDNFASGWTKPVKPLTYTRESLSDYVNGDAELFNELGFRQLEVQQYKNGSSEIDLELYELNDPNGAMGIYLLKCGKETPSSEITSRNSVNRSQLVAVKANFFIQVLNYTDNDNVQPTMIKLAQQALSLVANKSDSTVLGLLPRQQLQAGSEHVFCGPLSLQAAFRLGKGDFLQLQNKTFGASAKYSEGQSGSYSYCVVTYSDPTAASAAFAHLQKSLDPGIQLSDKTAGNFTFKDRLAKFGTAILKDSTIELKLNLAHKPVSSSK